MNDLRSVTSPSYKLLPTELPGEEGGREAKAKSQQPSEGTIPTRGSAVREGKKGGIGAEACPVPLPPYPTQLNSLVCLPKRGHANTNPSPDKAL